MVRFLSELLGRPPDRVAGVWVWWEIQPSSLIRYPPDAPAAPPQ